MSFTLGYKLNAGTQYEFTVSTETIAEAVAAEGGITEADIAPYCYTALIDSRIHSVFIQSSKNVNAAGFDSWQAENMPYYFIRDTRYVDSNTDINKNDTVYERNFLVWNGTAYPGTPDAKTGTFLVMDITDIKRWYVDFNAGMFVADNFTSAITESGVTSAFPGYNGSGYTYVSNTMATPVIHCDNNDPMQNPEENLHIINVLVINDDLWVGHLNPASHGDANTGIVQSTYNIYLDSYVNGYLESGNPTIYQAGSDSWSGIGEIKAMDYPDLGNRTTVYKSYVESSDGVLMEINGNSGGTFDVRTDSGAHCKDLNTLLKWQSWCGLKFTYDNIMYKPIIQQGVIIGYTDDMSAESEYDDMTNVTGNNISPVPPGPVPPGPGPYDDDPWSGATFAGTGVGGAGAFAKVYYMTSTELANLRSWMNSINVPEGFDPMQQVIGLSQVPVALSGSGPENVVFVNSSAVYDPGVTTRAVDTGVATQQAMGTPISYYLGSVDIVRRMQERGEPYLDYDCQIELYLPLIGMFSLDTQAVMGRTISAYAVLDPVSGTLAAYAYVSKDGQNLPVAYGSTTIGVDLPISAQQLSVSRAALKQANAQLGASLLSGALTMLAAASTGGKSSGSGAKTSTGSSGLSAAGIREAGSDYMKASQVGNVFGDFMNWGRTIRQLSYGNNTAVAGSFGGSTAQWSYPFTPYVKIIRPRYEKPSNYNHSQGVPCVQTKTIGSCTGFIQCIGADVSGITGATDLELQAIQAALSNGIYAGGGS